METGLSERWLVCMTTVVGVVGMMAVVGVVGMMAVVGVVPLVCEVTESGILLSEGAVQVE